VVRKSPSQSSYRPVPANHEDSETPFCGAAEPGESEFDSVLDYHEEGFAAEVGEAFAAMVRAV
jgi:hypothetical protein